MENFTGIEMMKQLWEKTPVELKEAAPFFLACVSDTTIRINTASNIVPLNELCTNLRNKACVHPTVANQMLNKCSNDLVVANRDQMLSALTIATEECHESVIRSLENEIRKSANYALGLSLATGFLYIFVEVIHIWKLWNCIKDARNIVQSSIATRDTITESLESLRPEILILNNYIKDMASGKGSELLRFETLIQIDNIREKLNKLENDIRDLEVNVNGMKVRLGASRTTASVSIATSTMSAATTSLSIGLFARTANPWLIVANGLIVLSQVIIGITNISLFVISKKDIKLINDELAEIDKLENIRKSLKAEFDNNVIQATRLIRAQASSE